MTAGGTATFTAAASGTPTPTVQWQVSTDGGASYGNIAGATSTTLTLTGVTTAQNTNRYRAVFTNSAGGATTNAATLTVTAATTQPQVTTQPSSQSVVAGGTATFTAAASGTPTPTVQWQVSTDGGASYGNIAGATSTTLTLTGVTTAQNTNRYRAVFTNSAGGATTNAATLTVTAATTQPQVTTQPSSQSVVAGGTATFTAAASGTPTPTVQWQVSTDGGASYANIAGATSATLTLTGVTTGQNTNRYRAVFTNSAGGATTNAATLTVTAATTQPQVTTQPSSQSVVAGGTATFTAAASGTPTPTVQWQVSTDGGASYGNIAGATTATLTLTGVTTAQNNNRYRAVFTNSAGGATTNAATLTVTATGGVPPNDMFANAQVITGNTGTITATNTGATKQTGEPNHAGNAGGGSIWYAWTPAVGGSVTIDTLGSTFDTIMGVYTGTAVNALTTVASNDDIASGNTASRVTFTVAAGTTYRIAIDGYNGLRGNVTLNWVLTAAGAAPANDAFANAQVLTGATGTITATNVNATKETGEPAQAGNAGGASVWYAWTPTAGGSVTIDTVGSAIDTTLGVYTGTAVNALTLRASNDDIASGNTASRVTLTVTAGTTYRISVDGYNARQGAITLHWQ